MNVLSPRANSLLLVLMLGAAPALADAGFQEGAHPAHAAPHAFEDAGGRGSAGGKSFAGPRQPDKKWKYQHPKESYASDYSSAPSRKATKMSAEERRALRRQINELGSDIYLTGN